VLLAPRRNGKTTIIKSFIQLLLERHRVDIVRVFSETALVTEAFAFLPAGCVENFGAEGIGAIIERQKELKKRAPHVLVVVDDVLGTPAANNCAPLVELFTVGRNLNISVAVLSQSLRRVTVPVIKDNADLIGFADLANEELRDFAQQDPGGHQERGGVFYPLHCG